MLSKSEGSYHNLLHSFTVVSGGIGVGVGVLIVGRRLEVVGHLGVQLGSRLLGWASIAAGLLLGSSTLTVGTLSCCGLFLISSGGLRLGLGLSSALGQGLGCGQDLVCLRSTNDDFDLQLLSVMMPWSN